MANVSTDRSSKLRPFLPRLTIRWFAEQPDLRAQVVDGTVVFVDISGFTKMSERLARLGKVGAEEVTDVVGFVFRQLLATAYANGGGLIKFGGDALLLFFSGEGHPSSGVAAAVGMRRALADLGQIDTSAGKVRLRMSVGVHSGEFHFFLVGERHRELLLTGPGASTVVAMEGTADGGEIVISPQTAEQVPDDLVARPKGDGLLLRRNPRLATEDADRFEPSPQHVTAGIDLAECIPTALRELITSGQGEPEHRRVSIGFIHYDGLDDLIAVEPLEHVVEAMTELVVAAQVACDDHGVTFLATDIDKDGGKIIVVAGAPTGSGNDEARILAALRQVQAAPLRIPLRIGVNTGPVFCGDIGPSYRRTYTVMGDSVNLAARVMAKSDPGQLLATRAVLDACSVRFDAEELEPFMVKGKSMPVYASVVGEPRGSKSAAESSDLPLIGRELETAVLRRGVTAAEEGKGTLIEIVGPPGVGKTRLLGELRAAATVAGLPVLSSGCDLYGATTPYSAARPLLLQALELPLDAPRERIVSRLMQVVWNTAPQLSMWLPLLGIPLDLDLPTNPEVEKLGQEFRRTRLQEAVAELLGTLLPEATVIIVEDTHWADEPSTDLFTHLGREIETRRWLMVVTRRDEPTGFSASRSDGAVSLRPEMLTEQQLAELLLAATEDAPLRPHEMTLLAERSGGNPLFLKELLAAARSAGSTEGLPETVEATITSQIDRLSVDDRRLLRHASVLGQRFTLPVVAGLFDDDTSTGPAVWRRLSEYVEAEGKETYRFRHALIRDAAYEGLPYRRRRELHSRAGETIERGRAGEDADLDLLAWHFFHAQVHNKAWSYSRRAADAAEAKFAMVEAAEHLERAVRAAAGVDNLAPAEIAEAYEALGDLRERLGQYPQASLAYKAARRLVADDDIAVARLCFKHSILEERNGSLPQALRWLSRGLKPLAGRTDVAATRERARLSSSYGAVRTTQGRRVDAVKWLRTAIEEAEASDERDALAHAYFILDLTLVDMGRPDEAIYSDRAMELYSGLGKLRPQAAIILNRGHRAWIQGRWDEAVTYYDNARQLLLQLGDVVDAAIGTHNIAEVLSDQGRLEQARPMFDESLRIWRAADYAMMAAYATSSLGRLAVRSGDFEQARELYRAAREQFQAMAAEAELIDTDARIAEALVFQQMPDQAIELATDALRRAVAQDAAQQPMLLRLRGCAYAQRGDWDAADADLQASVEVARARDARYEAALTLDAIAYAAAARGADASEARAEADKIFASLDAVSVARAPLKPSAVGV